MPLSYAHSRGDGINRNFDVPCEYLSKTHVTVKVDGVVVPFSWIDTYRLRTAAAPAKDTVVEVRRTTPREERLVTFTDGSTLVQSDLNTSTLQAFFLAQEAFDQGAASMAVTEDGQFSALNRRLTTMADPVNPQDAVTKSWALSAANTNLDAAISAKNDAQTARTGSEAARTAAQTARTGSETARTGSEAARDLALSYRNTAGTHKDAAETARAAAEAAKSGADASKVVAEQKASEATGSAAAAAKSAQDAALFDPSSYYTKSQMDTTVGGLAPKASPALTGNPTVPTQTAGNNSTRAASTAFVTAAVKVAADVRYTKTEVDDLVKATQAPIGSVLMLYANDSSAPPGYAREELSDRFVGRYESLRAYADEQAAEMLAAHGIKDDHPLAQYFDYEHHANEMRHSVSEV